MDKKISIILFVIGAIFFVLGGGLGILYQSQKDVPLPPKEIVKIEAVQILSSKVIPSITAFGQVTNIEGKNITLTFGGDSLKVKVRDDAQFYLPATTTKDKDNKPIISPQQTAKFSDIKIGNNVSVNLKLLPDGQIEGQVVIILGVR